MTLSECSVNFLGVAVGVKGDVDTRRRLADLGLIGSKVVVRAKTRRAALIDFDGFSAVLDNAVAANITVREQ